MIGPILNLVFSNLKDTEHSQVCSNGTRVFVQRTILEEFTSQLVERTKKLKIGNPMEPDVKVGATICQMQYDKILKYLDIAKQEGAKVLCGGGPVTPDHPDLAVSIMLILIIF